MRFFIHFLIYSGEKVSPENFIWMFYFCILVNISIALDIACELSIKVS